MIEPGIYEIEGFKTINRRYQAAKEKEITPEISNITGKRKSPPTLAFEVFAGKISYAGHIKFHHISAAGSQVKNENFEEISTLFANKNEKKLRQIFKGHHFEEKTIATKIAQNPQILILNLAKTKADFGEEKKIEKQEMRQKNKEAREKKKRDLKLLKEKAKSFKILKQQQTQPRKTRTYAN